MNIHQYSEKKLTKLMYIEVVVEIKTIKTTGRQVPSTSVPDFPDVSRFDYKAFLKQRLSKSELCKEQIKKQIWEIYHNFH